MADFDATEVRELLAEAKDADQHNADEAILDLKMVGFEQWDELDLQRRQSLNLPSLTVNIVQQYTALVVGDWLQNETSIQALPREDGDVDIAQIRSELFRSIELQSNASRIYASKLDYMVSCGISNFRVDVDYAYEEAFDKDIFIRDIPDPLAVLWDPLSFDPTGRDAGYCFVGDEMTREEYQKKYPDAAEPTLLQRELRDTRWWMPDTILVPEYWRIVEKPRTFGLTVDGKTVDLTDLPKKKWPRIAKDSDTKQPIIREKVKCKYAVRQMTNGLEALDDPYELRLNRLPIIRVMGRETRVEGRRIRYGIVRALRDDQRMKNYLRSIRAELLMKAARVNFLAAASTVKGREDDFENTLVYNDGAPPPIEVTARNLAALVNEENFFTQDMMEVTGIHEASRGMPSNETSGRAILARQNEGDQATAIYHANMTEAQQEAGDVINQLIPVVYDTARTIRTVGPDLGVKMVRINDPDHPESIDLGVGRYDVTISTGPSYATRRQEGAAQLMQLIQAYPPLAQVAGDIIVGELDLVNGQQLQERVKRTMPPQVLGDEVDDGKSPEEIMAQKMQAAQAQQLQQMQLQLQMQGARAELRLKSAQADKAEAEAARAHMEALVAANGGQAPETDPLDQARLSIEGYNAVTNRLKAVASAVPSQPGQPAQAGPQPLHPNDIATIGQVVQAAIAQALAQRDQFAPVSVTGVPQ